MSNVLKLLRLLSDGKPRTVAEIATECDFTMDAAHDALQNIRKRKATRSLGTPYTLTPEGLALLQEREAKRTRVEKEHKKRGRPRIRPILEPMVPKQKAETLVGLAMERQPMLAQVWGASP